MRLLHKLLTIMACAFLLANCQSNQIPPKVLVFSKTMGYRHQSIEVGIAAIKELGVKHSFEVEASEDASLFGEENLKNYSAVIFLSTTGDVLDHYQQAAFERYIQAGGGFVGIHAAADTEYKWPWYGKLVGAYFMSHPHIQKAKVNIVDSDHISADSLPAVWEKEDEWYNYKSISENIHVIANLDETSYEGGKNGAEHPIVWSQEYDGGKAFYTGLGHVESSYSDPLFLKHLIGGIKWVMAEKSDYKNAASHLVPEENRFSKVVLDYNLNEPTEMAVLSDESILFIERRGNVKYYRPGDEKAEVVNTFNVYSEQEDGMMGLALDPNFETNKWVYVYYSPAGDEAKQHLSRFVFDGGKLDMDSEKVMLEVKTQRLECCHTGGSIAFGPNGNLFLSTGDDTNPFESDGFGPFDEREGRSAWDAQRSSANTNDLRGKILRITPQPDGTYTIPEGNLFPKGDPLTRPEIYVMGCRNPYRISIDQKNGNLYWGDVGPDSGESSETRGQKGLDELNRATQAGFFGWPYFGGNNQAYNDYDFSTKQAGGKFNPANPINDSPNNTGLKELPISQEAMIWYSYDESEEFPILGTGGKTPMAGPVYYTSMYPDNPQRLPEYYNGKLFFYEWMRRFILLASFDENGDLEQLEPFMGNSLFSNPMDMEIGPNGNIYMLEYGTSWNTQNMDARLVQINYEGGNRSPRAVASVDQDAGKLPLTVHFSGEESIDVDGDNISYLWDFGDGTLSVETSPTHTYTESGSYKAKLTVSDEFGKTNESSIMVFSGNSRPNVEIKIEGNQSFFWDGRKINYMVTATDEEDGQLGEGIQDADVRFSVDYISQGYDKAEASGHNSALANPLGKRLMEESDCMSCHNVVEKSIGPSFTDISQKYVGKNTAPDYLAHKVIKGGGGVWGEQAMAAHPSLVPDDVREMVKYILALTTKKDVRLMPLSGQYVTNQHNAAQVTGQYIFSADYLDKGVEGVSPLQSNKLVVLQSTSVEASIAESEDEVQRMEAEGQNILLIQKGMATLDFGEYDLTDISEIQLNGFIQGEKSIAGIELVGPNNEVLASSNLESVGIKAEQPGIYLASGSIQVNTNGYTQVILKVQFKENTLGGLVNLNFIPKK